MKKNITISATILFLGCIISTNNKSTATSADSNSAVSSSTTETTTSGPAGSEISVTLTGGANALLALESGQLNYTSSIRITLVNTPDDGDSINIEK